VLVEARREDDALVLVVEDDGAGVPPGGVPAEGVGLATTRGRLRQLYGAAQAFSLTARPEGGARCTIRMPCRPAA
jgi:LytS/YehU family sensor histidine kinase